MTVSEFRFIIPIENLSDPELYGVDAADRQGMLYRIRFSDPERKDVYSAARRAQANGKDWISVSFPRDAFGEARVLPSLYRTGSFPPPPLREYRSDGLGVTLTSLGIELLDLEREFAPHAVDRCLAHLDAEQTGNLFAAGLAFFGWWRKKGGDSTVAKHSAARNQGAANSRDHAHATIAVAEGPLKRLYRVVTRSGSPSSEFGTMEEAIAKASPMKEANDLSQILQKEVASGVSWLPYGSLWLQQHGLTFEFERNGRTVVVPKAAAKTADGLSLVSVLDVERVVVEMGAKRGWSRSEIRRVIALLRGEKPALPLYQRGLLVLQENMIAQAFLGGDPNLLRDLRATPWQGQLVYDHGAVPVQLAGHFKADKAKIEIPALIKWKTGLSVWLSPVLDYAGGMSGLRHAVSPDAVFPFMNRLLQHPDMFKGIGNSETRRQVQTMANAMSQSYGYMGFVYLMANRHPDPRMRIVYNRAYSTRDLALAARDITFVAEWTKLLLLKNKPDVAIDKEIGGVTYELFHQGFNSALRMFGENVRVYDGRTGQTVTELTRENWEEVRVVFRASAQDDARLEGHVREMNWLLAKANLHSARNQLAGAWEGNSIAEAHNPWRALPKRAPVFRGGDQAEQGSYAWGEILKASALQSGVPEQALLAMPRREQFRYVANFFHAAVGRSRLEEAREFLPRIVAQGLRRLARAFATPAFLQAPSEPPLFLHGEPLTTLPRSE